MNTGLTKLTILDIYDKIIKLGGLSGCDDNKLDGVIGRIESYILYKNVEDVFEIAALYLVSLAKAHAFTDGNKRTSLLVALTYLKWQGISYPANCGLDDFVVEIAASQLDHGELIELTKNCLYDLAEINDQI